VAEPIEITVLDNGPFLVKGTITLMDGAGQPFHPEREPIALCRCGASTNRPFCDGSHAKIGFQSSERAT
jgi:CDGSH iron-sulfur domain-containing protein 3